MKSLVLREHGRIDRWGRPGPPPTDGPRRYLEPALYDRLRAFDRAGRAEADRVFDWRDGHARAQQWVGVLQVPGLQVEILPKIDAVSNVGGGGGGGGGDAGEGVGEPGACVAARRNLLYMLALAGDIPLRVRDLARLADRRAALSETLAALFAERLRAELLRGPERGYLAHEENLRCFKGKLLVPEQALRNGAHRERFFCRYDLLTEDTPANRIFRAVCVLLLGMTHTPATQDVLRHCLLLLDGVRDVVVHDGLFDRVSITRQNERFADLLAFCRLVLGGRSPTAEAGQSRSFSLLFDMNQVFERFVAAFLARFVTPRMEGARVFPQAHRHRRHLMECGGSGVLPLKPDLLVECGPRRVVMDTKWKRLDEGGRGRGGVAVADLYQLYAYTRRYGCAHSVLLFPRAPGVEERDFDVLGTDGSRSGERVAVRYVDLHRDLAETCEREALAAELSRILGEALAAQPVVAAAGGGAA